MKIYKILLSTALIGALLAYSGCSSSSPAPVPLKDQQLKSLSHTWKCSSATLQGTAQTGYTSFTITMTGTNGQDTFDFTTAGRPAGVKSSPWAATGKFTFGTDPATQLTRDDNLPVTYSVSANQLQMTFNYTGAGFDGRVGNVVGTWVFSFDIQ